VLAAFDDGGYTRQELAVRTGIAINAICGRVAELLDAGDLEEVGRKTCSVTGERAMELRRVNA